MLAALIRTASCIPGGAVTVGGLGYVPSAGELTIGGVTEFGEDLFDDLRAEQIDLDPERSAHRAFVKELRRAFARNAARVSRLETRELRHLQWDRLHRCNCHVESSQNLFQK